LVQAEPRAKLRQPKSDQQDFSLPHTNFIKHVPCMNKNPPLKYHENLEKLKP
jgi:hypothetical protein